MVLKASLVVLTAILFIGSASATPSMEGPSSVSVSTDKNATFEIKFEIEADENGTYSIEFAVREEFTFENQRIEKTMRGGDSRTYIFKGENAMTLEDGEYRITWTAYKGDDQFNSGSFDVVTGEQASEDVSGFGAIVALASVGLVAASRRRT